MNNIKQIIIIQKIIRGYIIRKLLNISKYIQYYIVNILSKYNIKKITKKSSLYYALEYLYKNIKIPVYINDIKDYVKNKGIILNGSDSLQVRHLGLQYGFNIIKGGVIFQNNKIKKSYYMLINLNKPYNGFCSIKRNILITNDCWNKILNEYENKCVNCGNENGKSMKWNKNKLTTLQKGHMNPLLPLTEDNIIPQYSMCNQQYKNKAIFNKRGYIIDFNIKGFIN